MDTGWVGHLQERVALGTLDDTVGSNQYDPPLRALVAKAAGDVRFCLAGDDPTDAATKAVTLTLQANSTIDIYAIKKIFATGTTILVANLIGLR